MTTVKESWLDGEMPLQSPKSRIMPAVQFAREYFLGWNETEIRELWNDTDSLIHRFIHHGMGKMSFIEDPATIMKGGFITHDAESFDPFMQKWSPRFEAIELKKRQDITLGEVLLAAFLLKNASQGKVKTVMKIYQDLITTYIRSYTAKDRIKSIISAQNRKNAQASKKSSLVRLLEIILEEDPELNLNAILKRLINQTESDKKICIVESVVPGKRGFIQYLLNTSMSEKKSKTVLMSNIETSISRTRTKIKNKLPQRAVATAPTI